MINALLLLGLLGQEVDLSGQGRRIEKEYELTLTGKGLKDPESVNLRFRRMANRLNWENGAIEAVALEDETLRAAAVENGGFVYRERFSTPGEVEVRIGQTSRVFRASTLPEEAFAISSAARRFDAALRGLRLMVDDVESLKSDMCPAARRQAQLQKRIDWRRKAYREEVAESFLTASAQAFGLLMTDVEAAQDLDRSGKDPSEMVSSLTGKPFVWAEARAQIAALEAASLRERALLIVRTAGALAKEVTGRVGAGDARGWPRAEKEFTRALDALREADLASRTGPSAERYVALVDVEGGTIDGLLQQIEDYVRAGEGRLLCTRPDDGSFAEMTQSIADRLAAVEQRIRTQS